MEDVEVFQGSSGKEVRDKTKAWLKEQDGKIQIVARLLSEGHYQSTVTIVIFYVPILNK